MDATRVEFNYAIFVGEAAVTNTIVAWIQFDDIDALDNGIERVAARLHYFDGLGDGVQSAVVAICAGDGDKLGTRLRVDDLDRRQRAGAKNRGSPGDWHGIWKRYYVTWRVQEFGGGS